MGYDDVVSLKQTIQRLLKPSRFLVDSDTRKNLEVAYKYATSLQEVLIKTQDNCGDGGKRLNNLEGQIGEVVNKLEDFLELHQSDVFLDENNPSIDPERVKEEISLFTERAKKLLGEDYADGDACSTSGTGFGEEMVGYSDELTNMKEHVRSLLRLVDREVLPIVGATGTGRSLAVKKVFDDVRSSRELGFQDCVWVTVGPIYQLEEILHLILNQLLTKDNGWNDEKIANLSRLWTKQHNSGWGDEDVAIISQLLTTNHGLGDQKMAYVRQTMAMDQGWGGAETRKKCVWFRLMRRKYMIVLDDVWNTEILDLLLPIFPRQNNGSAVLVTTGCMDIAMHVKPISVYRMEDIPRNFADDIFRYFPADLEETGRVIARNCLGRRLCMSKVLLYLWSVDTSPETWNEIACNPHHPIFDIVDEFSEMQKIQEDFGNLTTEPTEAKDVLSPFVLDNGISIDIKLIKKMLFPERFFPKMEVISFVGMAGIGKTTFVKKIFEYLQNLREIERRPWCYVWVTLGPKYESENIVIDILAQLFPGISKKQMKENIELVSYLCMESLDIRFIIVLDDVWNEAPLRYLLKLYPNIEGRALLTTRFAEVAKSEIINITHEMRFLSKEESWNLLHQKVFGEGCSCPFELEKAGKKIAENCDGLPLTIVKVANLISKDLSPHYWSDVANKNSDFKNALEELSDALLSFY